MVPRHISSYFFQIAKFISKFNLRQKVGRNCKGYSSVTWILLANRTALTFLTQGDPAGIVITHNSLSLFLCPAEWPQCSGFLPAQLEWPGGLLLCLICSWESWLWCWSPWSCQAMFNAGLGMLLSPAFGFPWWLQTLFLLLLTRFWLVLC